MNKKFFYFALLPLLFGPLALVQAGGGMGGMGGPGGGAGAPRGGGAAPVASTPTKDDFKPSSLNQPGQQYPQVNSEGFARFRVTAPNAQSVTVTAGLGGNNNTPLKKGDNGVWEATTPGPMEEGFHYYHLQIDGNSYNDPGTLNFYGSTRWESGIEIPAKDQDFYALKDVPHGKVAQILFPSKSTNTSRRAFVYTPAGYDKSTDKYGVLYLQHGWGEDETAWMNQGRANLIMDNLLADKKCKPFLIVCTYGMTNEGGGPGGRRGGGGGGAPGRGAAPGGAPAPGAMGPVLDEQLIFVGAPGGTGGAAPGGAAPGGARGGARGGGMGGMGANSGFDTVLTQELIPYVDANFRTYADQAHRAMAGLSMGGMETHSITLAHPDTFAYYALLSGGTYTPAELASHKSTLKLAFMSCGSFESAAQTTAAAATLKAEGFPAAAFVSQGTRHEFQTWRRSLLEMAPMLFKD